MNPKRFILLSLIGSSCLLFSQKKNFTMAEAVNGLRTNLARKTISNFSWDKDSKGYTQIVKGGYLHTDYPSMKTDTLVSLYQLNQYMPAGKKLSYMPYLTFVNLEKAYYNDENHYYILEKKGGRWTLKTLENLPKGAENINVLNDGGLFVYTIKNNLYLQKNSIVDTISNEKDENIISGQFVHRNEFGVTKGIFPAPDNSKIAFYRKDQTMVKDYPIIDWSVVPAENHNIKYPMAGKTSEQVKLGVYDVKSHSVKFLDIVGPKDQYLTAVSWSPDSKWIFVGILNRDQNHLMMNQYDAATGLFVKTLFEEKNPKYVEPQYPMVFLPNSNTEYIWQSQRTGYNHLFLYDLKKGFIKQLTKGDWLVNSILGFNAKDNEIYYESSEASPLEKQLYKINWKSGKKTRLSQIHGTHYGILNSQGTLVADYYSNDTIPRNIDIIDTRSLQTKNILTAENTLKGFDRPQVKLVNLKADDGTPLYGKIILPTNFDPNKKYPAIVYLYNGPHVQLITDSFPVSGNLWYEYMAQHGYVVFTMDGRGSSNRGFKFESATFRQLGTKEMDDQLKGVAYLKSLPYVDSDRLGVHGWSFGGFMTTSLMLRHPGVFKAAVAGGPVMDWKMYEVMYTERYMDTPQDNPEGYETANLLAKTKNLKGKLLLIHGTQDATVVWQHTIDFIRNAVSNGVQLDYFVYPGYEHNVIGKDRVHLMQEVTDYFDENLKNSPTTK
ncbi:S9 family peptidase [Riemerella columbipharyngis]|uniref:Dipeptidyl-peptidase-4 n=1 Tax=Riemerella columbipharyngis TaxID=1071918 RepID=A0A1G7E7R5_9FLAO|nr:DPP IV N-terminal domain-containing protein [Riemerella columbipharyngis]SDE59744.1 dipeptidyl-peptidase-4 [Riemerella columbipharyngis]